MQNLGTIQSGVIIFSQLIRLLYTVDLVYLPERQCSGIK